MALLAVILVALLMWQVLVAHLLYIEEIQELSSEQIKVLQQCETIGLTAGASTPKHIIDKAEAFLKDL